MSAQKNVLVASKNHNPTMNPQLSSSPNKSSTNTEIIDAYNAVVDFLNSVSALGAVVIVSHNTPLDKFTKELGRLIILLTKEWSQTLNAGTGSLARTVGAAHVETDKFIEDAIQANLRLEIFIEDLANGAERARQADPKQGQEKLIKELNHILANHEVHEYHASGISLVLTDTFSGTRKGAKTVVVTKELKACVDYRRFKRISDDVESHLADCRAAAHRAIAMLSPLVGRSDPGWYVRLQGGNHSNAQPVRLPKVPLASRAR